MGISSNLLGIAGCSGWSNGKCVQSCEPGDESCAVAADLISNDENKALEENIVDWCDKRDCLTSNTCEDCLNRSCLWAGDACFSVQEKDDTYELGCTPGVDCLFDVKDISKSCMDFQESYPSTSASAKDGCHPSSGHRNESIGQQSKKCMVLVLFLSIFYF